MEKIAHYTPAPPAKGKKKFKGYTVDELRYRLMVNDLKIQFTRSRLAAELSAGKSQESAPLAGMWFNLDTWLTYGQIALFSYRTVKKILSIFHGFKKKR